MMPLGKTDNQLLMDAICYGRLEIERTIHWWILERLELSLSEGFSKVTPTCHVILGAIN